MPDTDKAARLLPYAIKPGERRNPKGINQYSGGRRFLLEVDRALRSILAETDEATGKSRRRARIQVIAERLVEEACSGNMEAMRLLIDRLWPSVARLEIDGQLDVTTSEKEAARGRLELLMARSTNGAA